ncbi:TetR/AcrR family transcriptional regulator [Yinghuangia sp. YIM S10712]|uniref:TetR/AcrR family transcriptional regulator n=1 Tax=Yinghuangia sp. YIM S10712 TaxID=3436930 RepID=UPI003F53B36D
MSPEQVGEQMRAQGEGRPCPDGLAAIKAERRTRMTPEREAELFHAVIELLREVGYDALTMDAVAARAHTSKATLYRQWQGKPKLVMHALHTLNPVFTGTDDTGSLEGDLHCAARKLAVFGETNGALLSSMDHAIIANPELGEMLRTVIITPEREAFEAIVHRAVARGELDHLPASIEHCGPILVHASMNRPLCEGLPATEEYLLSIVDTVILPSLRHS